MKIDKRSPRHWWYLLRFGLHTVLGWLLRPWCRAAAGPPLVLLYGHKLNGNLKSLYDEIVAMPAPPCTVAFLSMDPAYVRELAAAGIHVIGATDVAVVRALARVRAIVSDHGLHAMAWLPRLSDIRFADVWHGVPYKGWDADDFRPLHDYDEIWLSSRLIAHYYVERFGFRPQQVHVTGYGRTDRLVRQSEDSAALRQRFGLPPAPTRLILFAPTWTHEDSGRSVFPFGTSAEHFMGMLAEVCRDRDSACLFRTHLNTRLPPALSGGPFHFVPQDRYPDSEGVLLVSDVLVCDWSSIAFDFLVLERPTVFLDVPAPFAKGYTLGPEYRFGAVVPDLDGLRARLEQFLDAPESYAQEFGARAAEICQAAYDDYADGRAAARYVERLTGLLGAQGKD